MGTIRITNEELIEDLKRVAGLLNTKSLSLDEYRKHGKSGAATFYTRFGSWHEATARAGLKSCMFNPSINELFENLEIVKQILGRFPRITDLHPMISRFSYAPYISRLAAWDVVEITYYEWLKSGRKSDTIVLFSRGKRTVPKRMRYHVLTRDASTCRLCGARPPAAILHIDHIVPFSKGGKTEIDNLQTLCRECNMGKGAS